MRFPEFTDQWEVKKLGEVMEFKVTNSFSRENLNYDTGTVKNIHYGDIHTKFQTLFDITKEKVPYINNEISLGKISEDFYCKEGDVIFADASEDLSDIGKSIEILNLNNEKALSGLHTLLGRPNVNYFHKGFNGYLFISNSVRSQIQKESQGTKVLSINVGRISRIGLSFPSLLEQAKIASFLSLIDERIAAQSKIIDRLESLIKAINNKLLNCESNKIPSLRFPEFSEKWEVVPLKDIALKVNTKNRDNKVNVVFSNSATQGLVLQNEYFDKEIANKDNLHEYYIVRPDDFVYNPRLSSNAEVGAMSVNHTKYVGLVSPLYTVFRVENSNIDIIFLESIFKSKVWHNYMRSIANYGARDDRMNIRNDDFFDLPLYISKKLEQQKISLFLSSLLLKMKNEKDILSIYKQQKVYLLDNLFI